MTNDSHMLRVDPRIPPVPAEEWTDAMRSVFAVFGGEEARSAGPKYNVIKVLANHPTLALPWLQYNKVLFDQPLIPEKLREIIVLRVAWLQRCEYEYVQHAAIGRGAGLSEEHLEAIKIGAASPEWTEVERLVLKAVDETSQDSCVSTETWTGLAAHFSYAELLEIMFVIGTYTMLAMIFNSVGLSLEQSDAASGEGKAKR